MKKALPILILIAGVILFGQPSVTAAERIGDDMCLGCHDTLLPALQRTPHYSVNSVECEDCHGPGSDHMEDPSPENIISFRQQAGREITDICKSCHTEFHTGSSHYEEQRSCLSCHDMWHSDATVSDDPTPNVHLVKSKTESLCTTCHQKVAHDFMKPYRHKQVLFANVCLNCHNPHQSERELRARQIERKCITCHPDAGGPFVYVHLGTRHEGCLECHVPHGTPNPNLLTRPDPRFLCLSCHTDVPAFHDQTDPRYRQCTSCHTAVHGSNVSRKLFN